jgi:hypothetical protein
LYLKFNTDGTQTVGQVGHEYATQFAGCYHLLFAARIAFLDFDFAAL